VTTAASLHTGTLLPGVLHKLGPGFELHLEQRSGSRWGEGENREEPTTKMRRGSGRTER
jgi:hypothetical protein